MRRFEQWDFFRLRMHSQPDRFSHIARGHLEFVLLLPRNALAQALQKKPNDENARTSFILQEKQKKNNNRHLK